MKILPQPKKTIGKFLTEEDGKMTKESILKVGSVMVATGMMIASSEQVLGHDWTCAGDCAGDSVGGCDEAHHTHAAPVHTSTISVYETNPNIVDYGFTHTNTYGVANVATGHDEHCQHSSCCFVAGTLIATPNGPKKIEKIKKGEKIISYDLKNKKIIKTKVSELESPLREGYYKISVGKQVLSVTNEHPLYTKNRKTEGWGAINPKSASIEFKEKMKFLRIKKGDLLFHKTDGWVKITSINYVRGKIKTYNLKRVAKTNNFFAQGFLVHNKGTT